MLFRSTITGADGAGIGLCPLDSPCVSLGEPGLWKFSLDYLPKKPTVFVNLYNNMWNTNFPLWQDGSWSELGGARVGLPAPGAAGVVPAAWRGGEHGDAAQPGAVRAA